MSGLAPRVVRLGGSLLDDPQVKSRLRDWLAAQPPAPTILIVGGGPWVQAVRSAFTTHSLSEPTAHWLSIRAMSLTARLAIALWPEAVLLEDLASAQSWARLDVPAVLDVQSLMEDDAAQAGAAALPQDWSVTSDSIAALAARRLNASELVLLKSSLPRPPSSIAEAAEQGYVDACFPQTSCGLAAVCCVNLRDADFPSLRLEPPASDGG